MEQFLFPECLNRDSLVPTYTPVAEEAKLVLLLLVRRHGACVINTTTTCDDDDDSHHDAIVCHRRILAMLHGTSATEAKQNF